MRNYLVTFLTAASLAACGGAKPPPPTAPPPADEVLGSGATTAQTSAEPATPVEPARPAEPTQPQPPKPDPAQLAAAETAAYQRARPVFEKHCATCHTKNGKKAAKKKLDHFSMDSYPFGGHHTNSIGNTIRNVLAIDGDKKPTMPYDKPGAVQGDELATIKAWTEAWQASGEAGNHPVDKAAD